jgi:antitoxin (DNA-binding transcriptional repressor) of toxin-antitoxin stability system
MKFVSVRDLRLKPGEIWKRLEVERELIITSNGKPIALLTGVNEDTMESTLTTLRRARAVLAMEEMQRTSVRLGLDKLSDEEIESEVKAVRGCRQ